MVAQPLLVTIGVPMNFAICVAPAACVVRVAVTSSAVFALRVAVAARIVSTASIADSFVPRLAARTAGIVLRTLWYGVVFSIVLAPARNPSLKQNSHTSGQQEMESYNNERERITHCNFIRCWIFNTGSIASPDCHTRW